MSKIHFTPSPELDGHFKVKTSLPILYSKIGKIDLRKITLKQARDIYDKGTIYLEKVKTGKSKDAK